MRIKHVVKRGKASSVQDISEDSIPDSPTDDNQERDAVDAEAEQVIHNILETLANVANAHDVVPNVESQVDRDSEPNTKANPSESDAEKEDDTNVAAQESSSVKTPSVEMSHEKIQEPVSRKGKEPVLVASEEEVSDDEEVPTKASAGKKATVCASKRDVERRSKKKEDPMHKTPKTYKSSQVQIPEKKKKKGKKIEPSLGRKRKHVLDSDSKPDVKQDVPDISTTTRKK